jgi:hypothetical protein
VGFCNTDGAVEYRNIRIKRLPITASTSRRRPTRKAKEAQFLPLFNGKDLTGWQTHASHPGKWGVLNGAIVGSGRGYLYTVKDDFENFHVRIRARIAKGTGGGLFARCGFGPSPAGDHPGGGYEAQIDNNTTGMLFFGSGKVDVAPSLVPPKGSWFTQEIIISGNRVVELVNGQQTAEYVDPAPRSQRGRIALQVQDEASVLEFGAVEVKELPGTKNEDY